jgi:hypothetical protein
MVRVQSSSFGGLNAQGGPEFTLEVNGENWCLEGQNGSGNLRVGATHRRWTPRKFPILVFAYESALELLRPVDQTESVKELVARKIFEIARAGEDDPPKLCARALVELGLPLRE